MKRLLLFLLIVPFTMGAANITNPHAHWDFSTLTDTVSSYVFTNNGTNTTSNYPSYGVSGDSSPDSRYINGSPNVLWRADDGTFDFAGSFTVSLWARFDFPTGENAGGQHDFMISKHETVAGSGYAIFRHKDNDNVYFQTGRSDGAWAGCTALTSGTPTADTAWHHYVGVIDVDGDDCMLFVDGSLVDNNTFFSPSVGDSPHILAVGYDVNGKVADFSGSIDEVMFYNRAFYGRDVLELYNNGYTAAASGNTVVTFSNTFPNNNSHWNNDLRQNNSIHYVNADFGLNCTSHIIDGNGSDSQAWSNTTIWTNTSIDTTASHAGWDNDGTGNYWIECYNGSDTFVSSNYTITRDTVNPIITLQSNNFYTANNASVANPVQDGHNVQLNVTTTDTFNFGFNLTIIGATTGTVYYSNQSTNLSSVQENITNLLNISNWPTGQYNISTFVEDDHTVAEIDPIPYALGAQSITYDTPSANITLTSTRADGGIFSTEKLQDRYTFTYTPINNTATWTFTLESTEEIYFRGNLYDFPAFVTGSQWVDFNTGNPATIYEVKRESPTKFEIEIETENESEIFFQSLGGLNNRSQDIQFNISRISKQNENVSAAQIDFTWVNVTWDTHKTANGTRLLFNNGTVIATLAKSIESYNVTGLAIGTSYNIITRSFYNTTASGLEFNVSSSSENNLSVTTQGQPAMAANFTAAEIGNFHIYLTWNTSGLTLLGLELYRDGSLILNTTGINQSYNDTGRAAGTQYTYRIKTYANVSGTIVYNDTINSGDISQLNATTTSNTSILLNIFDESRNVLIDWTNCTINMVSDSNNVTLTSTSGTFDMSGQPSENYTVKHACTDYGDREQYIEVLNNSATNANLYLVNDSLGFLVPFTVEDYEGRLLSNVTMHLQRWFENQSAYVTVEMTTSSIQGDSNAWATLGDAWYKPVLYFGNYSNLGILARRFTANDVTNGVPLRIDVREDPYESWLSVWRFIGSDNITYSAATQQFSFTYNYKGGIIDEVCLTVYAKDRRLTTQLNQTCSNSASATIVSGHGTQTTDIYAEVTVETTTENSFGTVATRWLMATSDGFSTFQGFGLLLAGIIVAVFGLLSSLHPAIPIIGALLGFLGSWQIFGLGLTNATVTGLVVVGVGIIFLFAWRSGK